MTVTVRIPRLTQINHPLIEIPFKQPMLLNRYQIQKNLTSANCFGLWLLFLFFQLHNADQLADWCMNHLCVNYNKLCKMSPKLLRSLHPENQEYLTENRWPPVWWAVFLIFNSIRKTGTIFSKHLSRHPRFFFLILNLLQKSGYWGRNRKKS